MPCIEKGLGKPVMQKEAVGSWLHINFHFFVSVSQSAVGLFGEA